ncbi:MAG: flagellar biosynthetic protein FliR [Pseudobdellovibrionaceae bacterium]
MNLSNLTETQILIFALVLIRISSFILSSSIFGSPVLMPHVKILFSVLISFLVYPLISAQMINLNISTDIAFLVFKEIAVGLTLGFLTRLFFFTISMAGDLISITLGLSTSQLYNPMMGSQSNSIEQLYIMFATLIFFVVNGHHIFIQTIFQSFHWVQIGSMTVSTAGFVDVALFVQKAMVLALKMCAPVLVAIFITNMAMAILGRAVPQINVLVTSVPVTIIIGFFVCFLCLPLMMMQMHSVMDVSLTELFKFMKGL